MNEDVAENLEDTSIPEQANEVVEEVKQKEMVDMVNDIFETFKKVYQEKGEKEALDLELQALQVLSEEEKERLSTLVAGFMKAN